MVFLCNALGSLDSIAGESDPKPAEQICTISNHMVFLSNYQGLLDSTLEHQKGIRQPSEWIYAEHVVTAPRAYLPRCRVSRLPEPFCRVVACCRSEKLANAQLWLEMTTKKGI